MNTMYTIVSCHDQSSTVLKSTCHLWYDLRYKLENIHVLLAPVDGWRHYVEVSYAPSVILNEDFITQHNSETIADRALSIASSLAKREQELQSEILSFKGATHDV